MSSLVLLAGVGVCLVVLYTALAVAVAHLFTTPRRVLPVAHRGAPCERVQFCARGESLRLTASYLRAPDALAVVLLVHGRDACRGDELRGTTELLVLELIRCGLSVMMVDLRGHGESDHARLTFGRRERHDILGAVDFLLARGYTSGSIGVLGASMGGASAIAAAAEEPAIGALITDSAFASLDEVLATQFTRLTKLPLFVLNGALIAARVLTGVNLLQDAPRQNMRRLRGRPTLVIHAEHDPFVPVHHAHTLAEAGEGAMWITTGTKHLSSFDVAGADYRERVGAFFAQHLAVTHPSSAHGAQKSEARIAIAKTATADMVGDDHTRYPKQINAKCRDVCSLDDVDTRGRGPAGHIALMDGWVRASRLAGIFNGDEYLCVHELFMIEQLLKAAGLSPSFFVIHARSAPRNRPALHAPRVRPSGDGRRAGRARFGSPGFDGAGAWRGECQFGPFRWDRRWCWRCGGEAVGTALIARANA